MSRMMLIMKMVTAATATRWLLHVTFFYALYRHGFIESSQTPFTDEKTKLERLHPSSKVTQLVCGMSPVLNPNNTPTAPNHRLH